MTYSLQVNRKKTRWWWILWGFGRQI